MKARRRGRAYGIAACLLAVSCARAPGGDAPARERESPRGDVAEASRPHVRISDAPSCPRPWRPPPPERLADLGDGAANLRFAVDDRRIVLLDSSGLSELAPDGRFIGRLTRRVAGAHGAIELVGGRVYWSEDGWFRRPEGVIRSLDPATGGVQTLATGLASPETLAIRGGDLRWLDWKTGGVFAPDGGSGVQIAPAGVGLSHLATGRPRLVGDADWLYFAHVDPHDHPSKRDAIMRARWDGSELAVVAAAQPYVEILALDDEAVYWVSEGAIRRAPKAGGAVDDLARVEFPSPLHVHRGFVYFLDVRIRAGGYVLARVPTSGGDTEALYESPRTAYELERSGDALYWIEHGYLEGECRTLHHHWYTKDEEPKRVNESEEVCDGPGGGLLRLRLPPC